MVPRRWDQNTPLRQRKPQFTLYTHTRCDNFLASPQSNFQPLLAFLQPQGESPGEQRENTCDARILQRSYDKAANPPADPHLSCEQ
ncbi:hypothetical protein Q7P37_005007 [Cladosporium fusiforme]